MESFKSLRKLLPDPFVSCAVKESAWQYNSQLAVCGQMFQNAVRKFDLLVVDERLAYAFLSRRVKSSNGGSERTSVDV